MVNPIDSYSKLFPFVFLCLLILHFGFSVFSPLFVSCSLYLFIFLCISSVLSFLLIVSLFFFFFFSLHFFMSFLPFNFIYSIWKYLASYIYIYIYLSLISDFVNNILAVCSLYFYCILINYSFQIFPSSGFPFFFIHLIRLSFKFTHITYKFFFPNLSFLIYLLTSLPLVFPFFLPFNSVIIQIHRYHI